MPNGLNQGIHAEDSIWMLRHELEQRKLLRQDFDSLAAATNLECSRSITKSSRNNWLPDKFSDRLIKAFTLIESSFKSKGLVM